MHYKREVVQRGQEEKKDKKDKKAFRLARGFKACPENERKINKK
jgi:hypothetical protein